MSNPKFWIALDQAEGIGPVNLRLIHETLQSSGLSVTDIFGLTENELRTEFNFPDRAVKGILNAADILPSVEEDYLSILDAGIRVIPFFSEDYPRLLTQRLPSSFPPILYGIGDASILNRPSAAVLGDSDISQRGELIAYGAAKQLAARGIVTISGFAKGAGLVAHRSAIENGGLTAAVLPCGILRFKVPQFLQDVMNPDSIFIMSPFYPTQQADKYHAFARNRAICAMSGAAYIVEAPGEGGIFEAARSAVNIKTPLFTTLYKEYPPSAAGNKTILEEMGGIAVQRKQGSESPEPNMDRVIAAVRFPDKNTEQG